MSKSTRNLIIGFFVVLICGFGIWQAYEFGFNDLLGIVEKKAEEKKTEEQKNEEGITQPPVLSEAMSKIKSEEDILNAIHSMANTLIVPVDGQIWGKEPITKDKISQLISIVDNSSSSHKEELLSILNKWNSGDFSTAVEDHNKVWKLLGGTVGKAANVNEEGVKETLANLDPK